VPRQPRATFSCPPCLPLMLREVWTERRADILSKVRMSEFNFLDCRGQPLRPGAPFFSWANLADSFWDCHPSQVVSRGQILNFRCWLECRTARDRRVRMELSITEIGIFASPRRFQWRDHRASVFRRTLLHLIYRRADTNLWFTEANVDKIADQPWHQTAV